MTKLKLAVVTSHPIQYYAPIFRHLDRSVDLHVFYAHRATHEDQAKAGFGTAFEWDIDLLSGYRYRFLNNVAKRPSTARFSGCDTPEIVGIIREGRFDAVLVLGWYLKTFVQAIVAAKSTRVPVLVRGDSQLGLPASTFRSIARALVFPVALRVFDAALYVGQRSRAFYEHYHYPKDRLFYSPHCVDTEWFATRATSAAGAALREQAGIAPEQKVVLFAGKLVQFKRPLDIVEAVGALLLSGREITVMVAGAGDLERPMRRRAKQLGVRLVMLGFRNQTEMPACYAASNVLVLPSTRRETWGLVANEALASGCPVIASDAAGCAPDLAADGVAGRAYPVGDTARLANAIAEVLYDPPEPDAIRNTSEAYCIEAACAGIMRALGLVVVGKRSSYLSGPVETAGSAGDH